MADKGHELPSGQIIKLLMRTWQMAIPEGKRLPFYEDVALDNLVRFADDVAFLWDDESGDRRIARVGRNFLDWLSQNATDKLIGELRPECRIILNDTAQEAARTMKPVRSTMHRVREGIVYCYDLLVLPLQSRWGPPPLMVCIEARGQSFSLIDTVFGATDDGMLALTALGGAEGNASDFQIIAINDGACRLMRRTREDVLWKRLSEIGFQLEEHGVPRELAGALATGERRRFEVTYQGELGVRHLLLGVVPIGNLLSVTLSDVGEIKAREESFRLLFDSNPVPMWLIDFETLKFINVNDAAIQHYGYSRQQFLDMCVLDIHPEDTREAVRHSLGSRDFFTQPEHAARHLQANGSEIEVLPYARALTVEGRSAVLVGILDVTERRKAEARISYMANHDALTRLPNRMRFQVQLDEALDGVHTRGDRLAVLCLDLDRFKAVNDTLGHPIGDKLLIAVAKRLGGIAEEKTFVARLGGDEFAVIQNGLETPQQASRLAQKIITGLGHPYQIDGHQIVIGVSIGIALAPDDSDSADDLLRDADMALYRSKSEGRNSFHFFEQTMDAELQARRQLELDLRDAHAKDQFELHYQPMVEARTRKVKGFEALLRWSHPDRGTVLPGVFISLAEETGLITKIGEWVLWRACAEAATWPHNLTVAVNLSPAQFQKGDLVSTVGRVLAETGLAPQRLLLEITESVLLEDSEANLMTLHGLKALGATIAMDDFGTGYSSLGYLQKFPFDKIKIDQSFVRGLADQPQALAIIRAVIGLGGSLGIATTVEGVETEDQSLLLRSEGATEMQGYLFSRPIPSEEVLAFVALQEESGPTPRETAGQVQAWLDDAAEDSLASHRRGNQVA